MLNTVYCAILVSSLLLMIAVVSDNKILDNKFTKFFSGISMEIYLSHMVIFRVIQKLKLNVLFGNDWIQYIITVLVVITGASIFSLIVKKLIFMFENRLLEN